MKVVKRKDGFDIVAIDKDAWVVKSKIPLHISSAQSTITFRHCNGKNPLTVKDIADLGYL